MKGDSALQRAIYGAVEAKILDGAFGASRLPSERELAAEFGVARKGLLRKIGLIVPETATSEFFTRIVHEISASCRRFSYTRLSRFFE